VRIKVDFPEDLVAVEPEGVREANLESISRAVLYLKPSVA
jgi:hypothetical protein